ncbi:MAG: KH domain-containing protein [Acidobacteriota bacterium]
MIEHDRIIGLTTLIARAIVDVPDAVFVETREREAATVLRLTVAPSDVAKVIGKEGRMAAAMRVILAAFSKREEHRYTLTIVEYDKSK